MVNIPSSGIIMAVCMNFKHYFPVLKQGQNIFYYKMYSRYTNADLEITPELLRLRMRIFLCIVFI